MEKSLNPVFSVSDFIAVANQTLEYAFPTVEIEGEVASFKVNQSKFVFFDIKDTGGSIGCFMTVWQMRVPIEDGMKVIISAVPKLTQWGKFSLTIKSIRPSGEGALKKSFELLKAKLDKEGLFAPERKRLLPRLPRHVAVISSTQAAGYVDFIKILNDRWGGIKVDVAHVQVQGSGAPDQIIKAIDYFNQQEQLPEVIVIVRGGGSADDLSTFNDELLVRAIAGSRVPTLLGVGHEIDESLSDMVADVRAATPSNAAQILVPDKQEIIRSVNNQIKALLPRILQIISQQKQIIRDNLMSAVNSVERSLNDQIWKINSLKNTLNQLNPEVILARGYALIRGKTSVGRVIEIETSKYIIGAEVKNVTEK
ncbi:exodeoxyribonuclease VII large subunit [Candidatus Saccharibacteria bacterium HGW-Saccharibacteria-1]|jgi:exodeoxyribonuclease VII large subunit|nr:MAG: exodeoxyribonuclease VII large subunit [Candidatus Saccharibacteria bacterium HGW-Saccharibacteria-1]